MLEDSQQRQLVRDLFTYNTVCRSSSDGTLQTIGSYSLERSHSTLDFYIGYSFWTNKKEEEGYALNK